jgi:drug/metabolite transporter (DMT)-like permease
VSDRSVPSHRSAPEWLVWANLLVVYLVWGSTYLAIRFVVETIPPFLASGVRFTIAGGVLLAFIALRGGLSRLRVTRRELASAAMVGVMLLTVGNGLVNLGEITVPSGLAALIIGVVPLMVLGMRWLFHERVPASALIGVAGGFIGLAVLVIPGGVDGSIDAFGVAVLLIAAGSWSIGSYLSHRIPLPRDPLVSTAYQMLSAAVGLVLVALLSGEMLRGGGVSTSSLIGLAYLIVFGSLIAYTAYTWLLQHAPITRVSTYAYVNPVVAVSLGAIILDEEITPAIAFGAVLIVASVAYTIWAESGQRRNRRAVVAEASVETAPG